MLFQQKHIAIAIALLSVGAAHATVATVSIGNTTNTTIADPSGSGRVATLQALYGSSTLTFSNPGVNYSAYDANQIGGAIGELNTVNVNLTGSTGLQEQWKSYAQSGPGYESVFFKTRSEADTDPMNARYYASGEINQTNSGSYRIGSAISAPVSSLSIQASNSVGDSIAPVGSIQTVNSNGQIIISAGQNFAQTGGTLVIENMVFDIYNGKVTAKVSGTKFATGSDSSAQPEVVFAPQNLTLWTFAGVNAGGADISGPTDINPIDLLAPNAVDRLTDPAYCGSKCFSLITDNSTGSPRYAFQAKTRISNLTMTTDGLNFFNSTMGSTALGLATSTSVNGWAGKWGNVESNLIFRQNVALEDPPFVLPSYVPEPSTYTLMGMGLLGICLASRRRRQGSH